MDQRFWAKVDKSGECWLWTGASGRYGFVRRRKFNARGQEMAHRYSWVMHFGPIPSGMLVCHKCDTRLCVRPDHLFLGTPAQNSADMVAKSRQARGNRHGFAKLREEQIPKIRLLAQIGIRRKDIATLFFVSLPTIEKILGGKYWREQVQ